MNLLTSMAHEILSEQGYRCIKDDQSDAVSGHIRLDSGRYSLVLEAGDDPQEVTLYLYMPEKVPEPKRFAAMEYLTRVNFNLPMGHFEIDLDEGRVRFVTSQLVQDEGSLPADLLLILMRNALDRVETFFPGLLRITHGGLHAVAALAEVEEQHGYAGRHAGRYVSQRLN